MNYEAETDTPNLFNALLKNTYMYIVCGKILSKSFDEQ